MEEALSEEVLQRERPLLGYINDELEKIHRLTRTRGDPPPEKVESLLRNYCKACETVTNAPETRQKVVDAFLEHTGWDYLAATSGGDRCVTGEEICELLWTLARFFCVRLDMKPPPEGVTAMEFFDKQIANLRSQQTPEQQEHTKVCDYWNQQIVEHSRQQRDAAGSEKSAPQENSETDS